MLIVNILINFKYPRIYVGFTKRDIFRPRDNHIDPRYL